LNVAILVYRGLVPFLLFLARLYRGPLLATDLYGTVVPTRSSVHLTFPRAAGSIVVVAFAFTCYRTAQLPYHIYRVVFIFTSSLPIDAVPLIMNGIDAKALYRGRANRLRLGTR